MRASDQLADEIYGLHCDIGRLEAENAKLRELLLDTLMHPSEYCEKYGIECASWDNIDAHIGARMRELGIEVE